MSAPAQNARSAAEATITARTDSSRSIVPHAASSASSIAIVRALSFSARSSVIVATGPSIVTLRFALMQDA